MTVPASHVLGMLRAIEAALNKAILSGQTLAEMAGAAYVATVFTVAQRRGVRDALDAVRVEIVRVQAGVDAFDTGAVDPTP